MAKQRKIEASVDFGIPAVDIIDVPLESELSSAFGAYGAHVLTSRAIPDARDGLKPVHRRILYGMSEMGLRPDKPFVKVARISGQVMGLYHPHGDGAINDALVRLGQDFAMSLPLVEGHGNFGSLDSGAAAARYIEARLDRAALGLVDNLNEGCVDFVDNYDGSLQEPSVLPAAFPNLLVNGAEGIAVGMATKMAPHNLEEAVAAARLLLAKPKSTLDDLMAVLPGPDFPGGCEVVVGDGAREAYETGKGTVTMRAVARIEPLEGSRGRQQIVVSALPYMVGPEKLVESIKKQISDKKITFVSDVIDLSEGDEMALHIELKAGVNPEQALASLYALTPMQSSFAINNIAIVDGQPRVLSLIELLQVWIDFRKETVLRRSEFRRGKARARLHLVDGLLIALDAIDLVVKTIRASKTTSDAKDALMKHRSLKLSDEQATYVLEMPLRRLTSLEVEALRKEKKELEATITDLTEIIDNPRRLVRVVDAELSEYAAANPSPRRSVLVDSVADVPVPVLTVGASASSDAVVVDDSEYTWHLTAAGLLKRDAGKDSVIGSVTASGHILLLCADGVAVKVPAALTDGMKAEVAASRRSPVVGIAGFEQALIMGTRRGVVKALRPEWPVRGDEYPYIALEKGDEVLWVGAYIDTDASVFITSDAQLLRFPAGLVRPQGRSGGGMAGVKLVDGARVVTYRAINPEANIVTFTDAGRGKTTPLEEYPGKGRATGGVRCMRLLKGDSQVAHAVIAPAGAPAHDAKGKTVKTPPVGKRDAAGA